MRALSDEVQIDRTDTGTRVRIRRTIYEGTGPVTEATMTVDHVRAEAVRIALAGEIDMDERATVEQQVLDAISNQLTDVTLDLSALEYIDSAGMRMCSPSPPGSTIAPDRPSPRRPDRSPIRR